MALVVFLHGDGEAGSPNSVKNLPQSNYMAKNNNSKRFIFIAPVANQTGWKGSTTVAALTSLINQTIKDYKIDTKRVYIIGFSSGTIMTWKIVNKNPNLFAAAVPVSCCPIGCNANNFKTTKIRAISGTANENGEAGYNRCMRKFVEQINAAGGSAAKITYNGYGHGAVQRSMNYEETFTWMFKQKRK